MGKKAQIKRQKQEELEKQKRAELENRRKEQQPWLFFWRRWEFWSFALALILLVAYPFLSSTLDKYRSTSTVSTTKAIISTSLGNIELELYSDAAPKTVENFTKLAKEGYYNNLIWHRVIKGFMIQNGDPNGDGTGGESIWGGTFADEINPRSLGLTDTQIAALEKQGYKYNYNLISYKMVAGSLAMANSGPNTNGSQFFIVTESAQPHLDGKHTVFGKVVSGLDVAKTISEIPVDSNDKPTNPPIINSITIK